ncbi:NAD/NADP octopine/nopaline dehydrogenase family protein [Agrobacterium arsenijevicii]|uniref:Opine dehydrogenase domain-containing protein n=1 Tax=Agrobacterium arsenijevicii TaxID=1585697 RepID=A0ABR5CZ99_9HYPH|nr:hypothetical protein RP75_27910 [Agrobacterium arsenijevicii]
MQTTIFDVGVFAAKGHTKKLETVEAMGYLQANGSIKGHYRPRLFRSLAQATSNVDILVNMMPADGHEALLDELAGLPVNGARAIFVASVFSAPNVKRKVPGLKVLETPTLPYVARWGQSAVNVYDIKKRYIIGPTFDITAKEKEEIAQLFSLPIDWQPDGLLANLKAVNPIIHTAACVLGYEEIIEAKGQTHFYRNIMARADICAEIEEMSKDIVAVQKAYGYKDSQIEDTLTTLNKNYGTDFKSIKEFAENSVPHNSEYMCPTTLPDHRYLTQDAKHGLVYLCEVARLRNVEVPAFKRVLKGASDILNEDLSVTGRTLANCGMEDATANDILAAYGAKHRV